MEMTKALVRGSWLLLAVFALAGAPGVAWAQAPTKEQIAEARQHYQKGLELYEEGDFEAALVELQRAYDTAPAYKILYNIGLVQRQLKDYAACVRSFRKYLEDGGKKIDAKRRAEVEREVDKLQGRVASVKLSSNVEGATVLVDDQEVAETPLDAPLIVNQGRRKISITKSGYASATRVLKIAGGDSLELELELRKTGPGEASGPSTSPGKSAEPVGPSQPDTAPDPEARGSGFPWLPWAITGALAAGTVVAGAMTLSAQGDLKSERDGVTTRRELDEAGSRTRTLALVTDVLLAATVVSAGISLYITLGSSDEPAQEEKAGRPLQLGVGIGSVELRGAF
jgi:hypothetical protein